MPSTPSSKADSKPGSKARAAPAAKAKPKAGSAKARQARLSFDCAGLLAGVDEAGRGPLAGPVVAAAVILDDAKRIRGLDDSKVLTPLQRERLYDQIRDKALCCSVGQASVEEIESLNIFHATMLAMKRAVEGLRLKPAKVLVDGNRLPRLEVLCEAIVDGDAKVKCISAASIIAKVTRDRLLVELDEQYPLYGFAAHKGYSTPEHLAALRTHGPCPQHRRLFAPVAAAYAARGEIAPLAFVPGAGGEGLHLPFVPAAAGEGGDAATAQGLPASIAFLPPADDLPAAA